MSFDPEGLREAIAAHGPVVRVVVAEVQGSAPREVGAAMLVWRDGQSGTIGGGTLEYRATIEARDMLAAGERRRFSRAILGPDMGQCCGGAVAVLHELFLEAPDPDGVFARPVEEGAARVRPVGPDLNRAFPDFAGITLPTLFDGWFSEPVTPAPVPVIVWGAGHVGRAIARALAPLPRIAVTLIDTAEDRFPDPLPDGLTPLIAPDPAEAVPETPADAHHFVLTHSHDLDFSLCDALLGHGFASAGLIGSGTKWARFRSRLVQTGHDPAAIDRISCPIGTPALGKEPGAIAVGVAHALLMELAKKEATSPGAG